MPSFHLCKLIGLDPLKSSAVRAVGRAHGVQTEASIANQRYPALDPCKAGETFTLLGSIASAGFDP